MCVRNDRGGQVAADECKEFFDAAATLLRANFKPIPVRNLLLPKSDSRVETEISRDRQDFPKVVRGNGTFVHCCLGFESCWEVPPPLNRLPKQGTNTKTRTFKEGTKLSKSLSRTDPLSDDCPCCKEKRQRTGEAWKRQSDAMWAAIPDERKTSLWSESHDLLGVGNSARTRDLIDVAVAMSGSAPEFVDLSQAVARKPWSHGLRSLVSRSTVYSFEQDRILLSLEHCLSLGFPSSLSYESVSGGQLKGLAGESMGMPCVVMAVLTVLQKTSLYEAQE
eukprot:1902085-Amphidinium_carterae.8